MTNNNSIPKIYYICDECGAEVSIEDEICPRCVKNISKMKENETIEENKTIDGTKYQKKHHCPHCQTEIIELKKKISAFDFLVVSILVIITYPLFGIGILIAIIAITFHLIGPPDHCPFCNSKLKFNKRSQSLVPKHWFEL